MVVLYLFTMSLFLFNLLLEQIDVVLVVLQVEGQLIQVFL